MQPEDLVLLDLTALLMCILGRRNQWFVERENRNNSHRKLLSRHCLLDVIFFNGRNAIRIARSVPVSEKSQI